MIREPPFGAVASGPPQPFAQAPLVGGDHGLRVARELAGEQPISGRGGGGGRMTVAPLVGPGWTAAQPVATWVVGTAFRSGIIGPRHPDRWNAPGELVRVIGQDLDRAARAIEDAQRRHGVRAADETALFTWQPSAAAAMANQALTLLTLMAIVVGLWALCLSLLAWTSRRRGARAPEPPRGMGVHARLTGATRPLFCAPSLGVAGVAQW